MNIDLDSKEIAAAVRYWFIDRFVSEQIEDEVTVVDVKIDPTTTLRINFICEPKDEPRS